MNLHSITATYKSSPSPFCLRFQQGTGKFQHIYFLTGKAELFSKIQNIFSFLFDHSAHDLDDLIFVQLNLSDTAGDHWEIKKKKDRVLILKNKTATSITLSKFLEHLNKDHTTQPNIFSCGSYHLSLHGEKFLMAPLEADTPENTIIFSYINDQISKILISCQYSFNNKNIANIKTLNYLQDHLKPLYDNYQSLQLKVRELKASPKLRALKTSTEIATLKKQIKIMENIAILTEEILKGTPSLEMLNLNIKRASEKLKENMIFCGLNSLPTYESLPDWNTPLHCLCYLNIIDKIIPQLSQWLEKFKQSMSNLNSKNSDFSSLKFSTLEKLNQLKMTVESNKDNNDINKQSLLWHKIKNINQFKNKISQDDQNIFSLDKHIEELISWVKSCTPTQDFLGQSLETFTRFLSQSESKRKSLRNHWAEICKTYQIKEDIDLHEFTQFTIKYNELIILAQQISKMRLDKESRLKKLEGIKTLLTEWYEHIGSQKAISLDNDHIIISEAQNILRYQNEKLRQLKDIENNRIRIETNYQVLQDLDEGINKTHDEWKNHLRKAELTHLFEIEDPRVPSLFEKCNLIRSLNYLQQNLQEINFTPAFSTSWNYESICIWKPAHLFLDNKEILEDFVQEMSRIPTQTKHILFYENQDINPQLRSSGLGQITQFFPTKIEDQHIDFPAHLDRINPVKIGQITSSNRENIESKKGSTQPSQMSQVLSPKARAALGILKGTHSLK